MAIPPLLFGETDIMGECQCHVLRMMGNVTEFLPIYGAAPARPFAPRT